MKKTIVITGGSDGLGKAIAKRLNNDNNVIIISRDEESVVSAANEVDCKYYVCDVTDYKQVNNTISSILEKNIKIDVLINNAGIWLAGDLTETDYERISNCIDVNTKGPIYMTKAVLPSMYENKEGLILLAVPILDTNLYLLEYLINNNLISISSQASIT